MDATNFTYWLNGFTELTGGKQPTTEQWDIIVEHLNLVFNKVTERRMYHIDLDSDSDDQCKYDEAPVCGDTECCECEDGPNVPELPPEPSKKEQSISDMMKDILKNWEQSKPSSPMDDYYRIYPQYPYLPDQPMWPGKHSPTIFTNAPYCGSPAIC